MNDINEAQAITTKVVSNQNMVVPYAVLAELTHRCPLQCPYCSNPVELERSSNELETRYWLRVIEQSADMGILHIHFSGGESTFRKDLEVLVRHAAEVGLYSNLITSAVLLNRGRLEKLRDEGLDHVQVSFQGTTPEVANRVAGYEGHKKKLEASRWVRELEMPLTVNAVMHRQNLHQLPDMINMAVELDAERLEVAQVQYYGWALRNRAAFLPTRDQLDAATEQVEKARSELKGVLVIDYVVPDYYARRPKSCMGGWGRQFLNITPSGKVLPCHAAESISGLTFDSVKEKDLEWIWEESAAFNLYRGTDWMPEPCQSCDRREIDWGGCRCQAFALTGDAANTDPACEFSPQRSVLEMPLRESTSAAPDFIYRRIGG